MKQNVLYLMIVNLPTEKEMEEARVRVQGGKEKGGM